MKAKLIFASLLLMSLSACKKEASIKVDDPQQTEIITLSQADAMAFVNERKNSQNDSSSVLNKLSIDWKKAVNQSSKKGNVWKIVLKGQPVYQKIRQGYRQLAIWRNPATSQIEGQILEIIPDAIYLQKGGNLSKETFTGRVFQYDLNYSLQQGMLYSEGKQIGEIDKRKELEHNINQGLKDLNPLAGAQGKTMRMQVMESCAWYQDSYVNGAGEFTVHSERICTYAIYDDGMSWGGGGGFDTGSGGSSGVDYGGGGGSSSDATSPTPIPSNLPGEDNNVVDPKKMMDCFSQINDPNAAFVVRVYVIEPQPGTSFNVGANAFGHVAISLSKTSGNTTITQTVGFYPTGYGLEKLSSKSRVLDNGFVKYDISSTYYVMGESFQKVIDYISNPPRNYDFTDFNCAAFVYGAGQVSGIPIPDPTNQIGISGPGGAGFAKTPAGMASALREQKINNPNLDVNEAGGRIPASKGPCN